MASSASSEAPPLAIITGSSTTGAPVANWRTKPPSPRAHARPSPACRVFQASAPRSLITASICARTISGGIVHAGDAQRVLHRDRRHRRHGVAAERGDGLDVGLNARAAAGIRAGDDEDAALGFRSCSFESGYAVALARHTFSACTVSATSCTRTIAAPFCAASQRRRDRAAERVPRRHPSRARSIAWR